MAGKARPQPYDYRWRKLAARHLCSHPVCAFVGCGMVATEVDHIVPVRIAPHRKYDPTNLQSLCKPHHSQLTSAYDAGRLAGACDIDGMPLDPCHPWAADMPAARLSDPMLGARLKQAVVTGKRR